MGKKIKPIGGMLLVKKAEEVDKTTKSGLVITADIGNFGPQSGEIIDMGIGEVNFQGDLVPIQELQVGDTVFFPQHTGTEIEDEDNNKYLLINYKHILARLGLN